MNKRKTALTAVAAAVLVMVGVGPAAAESSAANGTATNDWNQGSKNYYLNHQNDDIGFVLLSPSGGKLLMKWVKCSDSSVQGKAVEVFSQSGIVVQPTIIGRDFAAGSCVRLAYKRALTGPDTAFTGRTYFNENLPS